MKKNIKGFTLIELLAVIVILAIIALIATPIILNVIANARKASGARSVEAVGKSIINASTQIQYKDAEVGGNFTVLTQEDTDSRTAYYVCKAGITTIDESLCEKAEYSGTNVTCPASSITITEKGVTMSGCTVGADDSVVYDLSEQGKATYKNVS